MTERKPSDITFTSWVDQQIHEAAARGEFDNLPGTGKPLPAEAHREGRWLRNYLQREGLSGEALLPPSLQLRKAVERIDQAVDALHSEQQVRAVVAELNRRIREYHRMPSEPYLPVHTVDVEAVVNRWQAEQDRQRARRAAATTPDPPRKRWWQRRF